MIRKQLENNAKVLSKPTHHTYPIFPAENLLQTYYYCSRVGNKSAKLPIEIIRRWDLKGSEPNGSGADSVCGRAIRWKWTNFNTKKEDIGKLRTLFCSMAILSPFYNIICNVPHITIINHFSNNKNICEILQWS